MHGAADVDEIVDPAVHADQALVAAAIETVVALNLGVVAHGVALFLISPLLWCAAGLVQRRPSLLVLQGTVPVINLLGLWQWSGNS